jgi:uncharacterized protein (TIGR02594 family)
MSNTVQSLQRRLIALGYDLGPSGADGDLGRKTTAAIAKFQADRKLDIQYPGTIGPKTLAALDLDQEQHLLTPPWILLAKRKMGLHEVRDNAGLKAFLKSDGHALGDPAKLPWCGDFVETCIAVSLPKETMISNPYWALNWLKFGREVLLEKPVMGAIGVKSRDGGGHVFFVVGHDKTYLYALGGNQSNSISIVKIAKRDVKGLRFPTSYPMPEPLPFSTFNGKLAGSEA